ncbi:MAG: hypothetical protein LBU57_08325 [Dysgonamonadaceae bacterium]|jgi:hypothetical protein|nr:hypothetical protein [Dysgonamonadaceae bacterium]
MKNKGEVLKRIVRFLILRGSFTDNIGLLQGKLGICIFFYRYARFTGKKYYSDFADDLIGEIYEEIRLTAPGDFRDGLSGICWGIEYIIRDGYADADADDVLEDLDIKVLERDVRRVVDPSLETGLDGLAHYVLGRCLNKKNHFLTTKEYITDLIESMQKNKGSQELIHHLINLKEGKEVEYTFDILDKIASRSKLKGMNLLEKHKIGIIDNGLTGIALKLLNEIES